MSDVPSYICSNVIFLVSTVRCPMSLDKFIFWAAECSVST